MRYCCTEFFVWLCVLEIVNYDMILAADKYSVFCSPFFLANFVTYSCHKSPPSSSSSACSESKPAANFSLMNTATTSSSNLESEPPRRVLARLTECYQVDPLERQTKNRPLLSLLSADSSHQTGAEFRRHGEEYRQDIPINTVNRTHSARHQEEITNIAIPTMSLAARATSKSLHHHHDHHHQQQQHRVLSLPHDVHVNSDLHALTDPLALVPLEHHHSHATGSVSLFPNNFHHHQGHQHPSTVASPPAAAMVTTATGGTTCTSTNSNSRSREDMAIRYFQNELTQLYRRSMLKAGYCEEETCETSHSYQHFAFHAWKNECERLQTVLGDFSLNNNTNTNTNA